MFFGFSGVLGVRVGEELCSLIFRVCSSFGVARLPVPLRDVQLKEKEG